jgi:hypothetical protein
MCERDNDYANRTCIKCHAKYYGPLGHRGCPGFKGRREPALPGTQAAKLERELRDRERVYERMPIPKLEKVLAEYKERDNLTTEEEFNFDLASRILQGKLQPF